MAQSASLWFWILLAVIASAHAQRTVQDDFISPSLPDESVTIMAGTTYTMQWTGQLYTWFKLYAPHSNYSNVDLYITGTDNPLYVHLIQTGVDVQTIRSIVWNVSLPDNELLDTPYYTFRFIQAGSVYSQDGEHIDSPRVVIRSATLSDSAGITATGGQSSSSTTADIVTTKSATTTTDAASVTSGLSIPNATNQSAQAASGPAMSGGTIAAVVLGTVFGLTLFAALIWFIVARGKRKSNDNSQSTLPIPTSTQSENWYNHHGYYVAKESPAISSENKSPLSPSYGQHHMYVELPPVPASGRAQLP